MEDIHHLTARHFRYELRRGGNLSCARSLLARLDFRPSEKSEREISKLSKVWIWNQDTTAVKVICITWLLTGEWIYKSPLTYSCERQKEVEYWVHSHARDARRISINTGPDVVISMIKYQRRNEEEYWEHAQDDSICRVTLTCSHFRTCYSTL